VAACRSHGTDAAIGQQDLRRICGRELTGSRAAEGGSLAAGRWLDWAYGHGPRHAWFGMQCDNAARHRLEHVKIESGGIKLEGLSLPLNSTCHMVPRPGSQRVTATLGSGPMASAVSITTAATAPLLTPPILTNSARCQKDTPEGHSRRTMVRVVHVTAVFHSRGSTYSIVPQHKSRGFS